MRLNKPRLRPKTGSFSKVIHTLFNVLLPVLLYIFIRTDFFQLAIAVILLSKWRIFAVKMRHWPANIRANAVDILVGLSVASFMHYSGNASTQVIWGVLYALWLIFIKPQSAEIWVGLQAIIALSLSLTSIYIVWPKASTLWLSFTAGAVAYLTARHFFAIFDEAMSRASAYSWAFIVASLTWVSSHWLIYYGRIAQPALLISIAGYGLGALYYLNHTDRLSKNIQRQIVLMLSAITLFILVFSDWSDKAV